MQETQITVKSVFISRFTMNNIALTANCKNAGHTKVPSTSHQKC